MPETDYSNLDDKELTTVFQRLDPESTRKAFPKLPLSQIPKVISLFQPQLDTEWQDKLHACIRSTQDREKLQTIGKQLSIRQIKALIQFYDKKGEIPKDKFLALLMGIKPNSFEDLMRSASEEQITTLQSISETEPLHTQLTLLLHTLASKADKLGAVHDEIKQEINQFEIKKSTRSDVEALFKKIDDLSKRFERAVRKSNNALALAWSGGYEELIEKFTAYKESWLSYWETEVGSARVHSGLYANLERRLSEIFSKTVNQSGRIYLEDDDPSTEGLALLSIWSLEDYAQVGLLPGYDSGKRLKEHLESLPQKKRQSKKTELQQAACENLESIQLSTVKDLKEQYIFSKGMLKEYIAKHADLLSHSLHVLD